MKRTDPADAFSLLAVQVLRLASLLTATGDTLTRPHGHTSARWQVLAAIEDAPATVASIARTLGFARQSVQRLADVLTHDGATTYQDNPTHRRARLLTLTPQGRHDLHHIQLAQREWANAVSTALSGTDLTQATSVLQQVQRVLDAHAVKSH